MADKDDVKEGKEFHVDIPAVTEPFFLKGSGALDWGMQNRLARIFNPESGRTVMLAFDHGYFQGPTTGLERIDVNIMPLVPYADVLMCTRGALRTSIPAAVTKPVVLRCSAGQSILTELSNELIAVDIEDALRLGVAAMAAQVYIGAEYEHKSIANVVKLIDTGTKYGIPTLAVTGVGADMTRDERYFSLATRICAEIGAHYVKSYYFEPGFERVVAGCPVPIVIAGGKKLPEKEALEMAYKACDQGAAGVDMGRNIFQSDSPVGMIQAVGAVVHGGEKPAKAMQIYEAVKADAAKQAAE
ncbi:MAG: 3-hydroxy-5-phosphonooxypentane-2,4-dione thiolase [Rhodospirillales bacterium]|jgi:putative autoinducer-2 (AI-2) aldolase|nr:3-hydroxy-5-phosphonooxypentane-2,4-dione thiolase [Rhodospirillales bacterium]MDP6646664.1 3-hydroxy-5-phosphonooxypentane-2,4-dione thiolase [Rhodospirillales bacterium]MDP6840925.1 3-hydroxy-5-phosphonooxypentane-2,4-dione thiolase [Rhodospirillales bacterium]|tara:strand:- start:1827 stop:2726 length:900 start_codon:yes stop_codon:yes gene_type:complete